MGDGSFHHGRQLMSTILIQMYVLPPLSQTHSVLALGRTVDPDEYGRQRQPPQRHVLVLRRPDGNTDMVSTQSR